MPADAGPVAQLFREYADSLGVDLSFQHFDEEVRDLPGKYAPPKGTILLARSAAGDLLGCGAVRPVSREDCEMKRLYVRQSARGTQLGRRLAVALIDFARGQGYSRMLLDTLATMQSAHRLYDSLGFREVAPYIHNPLPGTKFLALSLSSPPNRSALV
jgi:GNAT superfamily N-acetyltransferase